MGLKLVKTKDNNNKNRKINLSLSNEICKKNLTFFSMISALNPQGENMDCYKPEFYAQQSAIIKII